MARIGAYGYWGACGVCGVRVCAWLCVSQPPDVPTPLGPHPPPDLDPDTPGGGGLRPGHTPTTPPSPASSGPASPGLRPRCMGLDAHAPHPACAHAPCGSWGIGPTWWADLVALVGRAQGPGAPGGGRGGGRGVCPPPLNGVSRGGSPGHTPIPRPQTRVQWPYGHPSPQHRCPVRRAP